MKRFLSSLPVFVLFAATLLAQGYRGRVQGTVADPSNASVAPPP
jgi:hypothetical protein